VNDADLYSAIILGTTRSPGVVTLTGHNREENWDIQAAKGSAGASTVLNGRGVGQFQATFYLADQEDFDDWAVFQRVIESTTNGTEPTALPIYHPDLALNGFTEVSNGGVGGIVRDERGGWTVQVKFLEFRPPRPKAAAAATARGGTTASTTTGSAAAAPYDPNAAAKRELAGLLEEAATP